jgi:hypothetical protein
MCAVHGRHARQHLRIASAVHRQYFVHAIADRRQLPLQELVMRGEDVLRKLSQRGRLPIPIRSAEGLCLLNGPQHVRRLQSLGEASLIKRLLSATAIVQSKPLQCRYSAQ